MLRYARLSLCDQIHVKNQTFERFRELLGMELFYTHGNEMGVTLKN